MQYALMHFPIISQLLSVHVRDRRASRYVTKYLKENMHECCKFDGEVTDEYQVNWETTKLYNL